MPKQLCVATIAIVACLALFSSHATFAELPNSLPAGDAKLALNGSGTRTKYLMEMYTAGLYLARPSTDPVAIVAVDAPMAIRLEITSGLVTEEKLAESLNEGFYNATGGKPEPLRKEIDLFRKCLAGKIAKGDVLDLVYLPGRGVIVAKNGKQQGVVEGLAFKRALFGVWLSANPADKGLKRAMLLAKGNGGQTVQK
jgi:hypothetical protein